MPENLPAKLNNFDPDFSPNHQTNIEAANQKNLRFDYKKRVYVNSNECPLFYEFPVLDKYGQQLG